MIPGVFTRPASGPVRVDRRQHQPTPAPAAGWSRMEVAAQSGVHPQRIHYWCGAGIFGPTQQQRVGSGRGRNRTFSDTDVAVAKVLAAVTAGTPERRLPYDLARQIADKVRDGVTSIRFDECGVFEPGERTPVFYSVVDVGAVLS